MSEEVQEAIWEYEAIRASVYGGPPREVLEMELPGVFDQGGGGFPLCYGRSDVNKDEVSGMPEGVEGS